MFADFFGDQLELIQFFEVPHLIVQLVGDTSQKFKLVLDGSASYLPFF